MFGRKAQKIKRLRGDIHRITQHVLRAYLVPDDLRWLWENPEAFTSLLRGLEDAAAGRLTDGPDLGADAKLIEDMEKDAHEKEWFQIISQYVGSLPINQQEAARFLRRYAIRKKREIRHLEIQVQSLLEHCSDAECTQCSQIICPHDDPLHFHHDGCPSCSGRKAI